MRILLDIFIRYMSEVDVRCWQQQWMYSIYFLWIVLPCTILQHGWIVYVWMEVVRHGNGVEFDPGIYADLGNLVSERMFPGYGSIWIQSACGKYYTGIHIYSGESIEAVQ